MLVTPQASETPFKACDRALRARGLRGNVTVGHLASKLVSVVYVCLLRGELYDPTRHWRELGLSPPVGSSHRLHQSLAARESWLHGVPVTSKPD